MIHAQQKGYEPPEVLRGLCDAVVRNFRGTIAKGKEVVQPPVAFIGGVAANKGAVQALREAFDFEDGEPLRARVPLLDGRDRRRAARGRPPSEARAAAVGALDATPCPPPDFPVADAAVHGEGAAAARHGAALRVARRRASRSTSTWASTSAPSRPTSSSSTRPASVIKEIYVKTDARPVEVVNAGLAEIRAELGDRIVLPRRRHHRLRPRAHRRAHRGRHRHRRDHRPQDRRRLHRPHASAARSTRSSRSAGRTPSSSACRTASSSTSP